MKGFMGCDADLKIGDVIVTGETKMVIVATATEEQARESAEGLGIGPLAIAPGERFYEVEVDLAPVGNN